METSEQINEIAAATAKAQGEITGARKDTTNTFYKSNYADLASCWDACREPLSKHGLAVFQTASTDENGAVVVTTMLAHSSGQWMRDSMACRPAKNDAQALGSVTTYLRRYGLAAIVGLAQVDDDGEGAVGRGNGKGDKMTPAEKKKAEWHGPLARTAFKNKTHDFATALAACQTQDEVKNLVETEASLLEQMTKDHNGEWWTGKDDIVGMDAKIQQRLTDLAEQVQDEPEVSDYLVPVPLASGKANWPSWKEAVEAMIDGAKSLAEVNEIAEANKAAYQNYMNAQPRNAGALKQIIDNKRGFFAQQPAEDAA